MVKKKMTVDFKGFEETFSKLDKLNTNTRKITQIALEESYKKVTTNIKNAITPHKLTGKTEKSLREHEKVNWNGLKGYINVGFDIKDGGLASIFLMYGTPKMKPDKKLYNSIYGTKIKKEVREIQERIFNDELKKVMK